MPLAMGAAIATAGKPQNQAQNSSNASSQPPKQKVSPVYASPASGGGLSKNATYKNDAFSQYFGGSSILQQVNLGATNTEFLQYAPKYATQVKAKGDRYLRVYAIVAIVLSLLSLPMVILILASANSAPPAPGIMITLFAALLVAGGILIYIGFKEFSREQLLSSTISVKIDAATYNLNKMQGKFVPYKEQSLKAPISGAECVYYSVGLYAVFWRYVDNAKHLQSAPLGSIGVGVPTLFTDGSGYLALDMMKVPSLEVVSGSFEISKEGLVKPELKVITDQLAYAEPGKKLAEELLPKIADAANNNTTLDISQLPGFKFKPYFTNKIRYLKAGIGGNFNPNMQNFAFYLLEQHIPVNYDYTCLGSAADIGKSIDGKPVKAFVSDPQTHTMAVNAGMMQNTTKGISKLTIIDLAFGTLWVITAFYVLSIYL